MGKISLVCDYCQKTFFRQECDIKSDKVFCSRSCKSKALHKPKPRKERNEYTCPACGKTFFALPSGRKNSYCSHECYHRSLIGKPPHNKGKPGKPSPFKGIWKLAEKKCDYCGKITVGRSWVINQTALYQHHYCNRDCSNAAQRTETEKLSRYSNGIEYRTYRISVFARDGGKCRLCARDGKTNRKHLQVHHIIPFSVRPDFAFAVDNGITLCKEHHDLMRNAEDEWAEQLANLIGKPLMSKPEPNSHVLRKRRGHNDRNRSE